MLADQALPVLSSNGENGSAMIWDELLEPLVGEFVLS